MEEGKDCVTFTPHGKVLINERLKALVVSLAGCAMRIIAAGEASYVTVELGADMIQLVENRLHFLLKTQVTEPWKKVGNDVEDFVVAVEERHTAVSDAAADDFAGTLFEPKRQHARIDTMTCRVPTLRNTRQDMVVVNVLEI